MSQPDIAVQTSPPETVVTAALRRVAAVGDWCVAHTTDGGHAKTSYHYSGQAVDLAARSGPGVDTPALAGINVGVLKLLPLAQIRELIYAGPGGICVKNGKIVNGLAVYGAQTMGMHHNHVHLAVGPDFTFASPTPEVHMAIKVNAPAVSIAITPSGNGYIILCADGGVFCFGDAKFIDRVQYDLPAGDDWSPAS